MRRTKWASGFVNALPALVSQPRSTLLCIRAGVCKQDGAGWCPEKDDCQQFPSPCPDIDKGWYMGNATHMPTGSFWPDTNQHEGYCSAHPFRPSRAVSAVRSLLWIWPEPISIS